MTANRKRALTVATSCALLTILLLAVDYARARVQTLSTDTLCECRLGPFSATISLSGSTVVFQCIQRDFIGNTPPVPVGDQLFVDGGFETHGVFVCPID